MDQSPIDATLAEATRLARLPRPASSPDTLAAARAHLERDWPGPAAAALLAPAWELSSAPELDDIPDEHWGAYADWLLACPPIPADAAQAEAIARHLTRRFGEIAGWMERNLAVAAVRAAGDACLRSAPPPLALLPAALRLPLQSARARVLQRIHARATDARAAPARPRSGRALRVGFLRRRHDLDATGCELLARVTHLDPRRIETRLHALEADWSAASDIFRERSGHIETLPADIAGQIETLRAGRLDVLVLCDDLADHAWPLAHLALHRVAPLQLAASPAGLTTGLPAIDLRILGELDVTHAGPGSERVALLPGTARAFDLDPLRQPAETAPVRATFGLPETSPVLLVAVGCADAPALLAARLARVLRSHPAAHLALALETPDAAETRAALLDSLVASGMAAARIHFADTTGTSCDLPALAALADLVLDPSPLLAAVAIDAGLPALARDDAAAAPLLRSAGLGEFLVADEPAFDQRLARLLGSAGELAAARERVAAASAALPACLDVYGAAQEFAALIETAWDELLSLGAGRFRRERGPVRCATPHSVHPGDLQAEARALLAADLPGLAAPCLLSAIQRAGHDASLWFDLAVAYRAAGRPHAALETLEASLRLDADNAAAWIMMCELAADVGSLDFAREALALAEGLRPDDSRLPALRARVAA